MPDRAVEGAEKGRGIDSVNPADIFDRVEPANWAAHALHPKLKEDPDGLWPMPHDIVHGVLLFDCVHRPVAVSRLSFSPIRRRPGDRCATSNSLELCGNLPIIAAAQRHRSDLPVARRQRLLGGLSES